MKKHLLFMALALQTSLSFALPMIALDKYMAIMSFDHGTTWMRNLALRNDPERTNSDSLCTKQTCFIVGAVTQDSPAIMRLESNQQDWKNVISANKLLGHIDSIACASDTNCFALLNSNRGMSLLASSDAGVTWNVSSGIPASKYQVLQNLSCHDQTCLLVKNDADFEPTSDHGLTIYYSLQGIDQWQAAYINNPVYINDPKKGDSYLSALTCNASTCVASTFYPVVVVNGDGENEEKYKINMLVSYDAGKTWGPAKTSMDDKISSEFDINYIKHLAGNNWIASVNSVGLEPAFFLISTDNGATWNYNKAYSTKATSDIEHFSSTDCQGDICYSTIQKNFDSNDLPLWISHDAGLTWSEVKNYSYDMTSASLDLVTCNASQCFAVGHGTKGRIILTSTDQGTSWKGVSIPVGDKRKFISFSNVDG